MQGYPQQAIEQFLTGTPGLLRLLGRHGFGGDEVGIGPEQYDRVLDLLVSRGRDAQRRPVRVEPQPLAEANAWLEAYRQTLEANFQRLDALLDQLKTTQGR